MWILDWKKGKEQNSLTCEVNKFGNIEKMKNIFDRFGRKAATNVIPCDIYFGQEERTISKR